MPKEARKSVLYAAGFVGFFFNVILLMGLCSIVIVGTNPDFFEGGTVGGKIIGGGNMVCHAPGRAVGGDLLLGFLAAVAFATILAVVSGLALAGASAISHDLYARVIKKGNVSEAQEIKVSKMTSFGIGLIAVVLGIAFEAERGLHGSAGLWHCSGGQFPGAVPVDVLERPDHARRTGSRLRRLDGGCGVGGCCPNPSG